MFYSFDGFVEKYFYKSFESKLNVTKQELVYRVLLSWRKIEKVNRIRFKKIFMFK
jgi:hypothetical protein